MAALDIAQKKLATQLHVFLAGPYVDQTWGEADKAAASAGARLRLSILDNIKKLEHQPILGEHKGVAEITEEQLKSHGSIALSELHLVKGVDAIVIVPDSPGSFAELGAWAMKESLCAKTLIFGNQQYEKHFSYVGHGVFPMAKQHNARVEWIDYEDTNSANQSVEDFLDMIQSRIISRKVRNAD